MWLTLKDLVLNKILSLSPTEQQGAALDRPVPAELQRALALRKIELSAGMAEVQDAEAFMKTYFPSVPKPVIDYYAQYQALWACIQANFARRREREQREEAFQASDIQFPAEFSNIQEDIISWLKAVKVLTEEKIVRVFKRGDFKEALFCLLGSQLDENRSIWGVTLLGWAIGYNHPALVKLLLMAGAKHDIPSHYMNGTFLPLHSAVMKKNILMIKALLDAGAEISATTPIVKNTLRLAMDDVTALSYLLLRGANTEGALHYAAGRGHIEAIPILLQYGADPLAKDGEGKTPREIANREDVRILLKQAEADYLQCNHSESICSSEKTTEIPAENAKNKLKP